jgi:MFS family permease
MICRTPDTRTPPATVAESRGAAEIAVAGVTYDLAFWLAYSSNLALMIGHSLLFRYADFVLYLGGSEFLLGWIVGLGMLGCLAMRLAQGVGIDRYGPRVMWVASTALFAVSCFGHLAISHVDGPAIFLLRIAYNCAIAGFFGASITFISARAPVARMAEVVGMLGTSGFLAMVLGAWFGDLLLGQTPIEMHRLHWMFSLAGSLGVASMVLGYLATRGEIHVPARRQISPFALLKRYHPGAVLLVGAATGFGLGLPGTFLRPYAASIGIPKIAVFFAIYAPTAFVARFMTRRLPERLGNRAGMLLGLGSMSIGMLLLTTATNNWLFAPPAMFLAVAHALLFPSVIAAASEAFPIRNRGLATTLILAMFDVGTLVGSPIAGAILTYSGVVGLPSFPTMFTAVAIAIATSGLIYALAPRPRKVDRNARRLNPNGAPSSTELPSPTALEIARTRPQGSR